MEKNTRNSLIGVAGAVALLVGGTIGYLKCSDRGDETSDSKAGISSGVDGGLEGKVNTDEKGEQAVPEALATLPFDIEIYTVREDAEDLELPLERKIERVKVKGKDEWEVKTTYETRVLDKEFTYKIAARNPNGTIGDKVKIYRVVGEGKKASEIEYVGGRNPDGVARISLEDDGNYRLEIPVRNTAMPEGKQDEIVKLRVRVGYSEETTPGGVETSGSDSHGTENQDTIKLDYSPFNREGAQ